MTIHSLRPTPEPCTLHVPGTIRLLSLLPAEEHDRLVPLLEKVALQRRELLFSADTPLTHVFFPLTAIGSLVITMDDGDTVEVGTVGNEGLAGVPLVLGADRSPA